MVTTRVRGVDSAADYPTPYASPAEMSEPPPEDKQTRRLRAKKKFDDSLTGQEYDQEIIKQQNAKMQKSKQTTRAKSRKTKDADSSYQPKPRSSRVSKDQTDTNKAKRDAGTNTRGAGATRLKLKLRAPQTEEEYHETTLGATPADTLSPARDPDSDDKMVKRLYEKLHQASTSKIQTELPYRDDTGSAWTAKQLSDLYIYCYQVNDVNLCDMIADTWIRAFHRKNEDVDKNAQANKRMRPWQKVPHLYRNPNAVTHPASYFVPVPKLDKSVTLLYHNIDINAQLQTREGCETLLDCVNNIYDNTSSRCPVRLLWADILALHGHRLENLLNPEDRQMKHILQPDLASDIMNTALRLVRRNLTLKCEEKTKGAWCKKYHMHEQLGKKCYAVLAEEQQVDAMEIDKEPKTQTEARHVAFADTAAAADANANADAAVPAPEASEPESEEE